MTKLNPEQKAAIAAAKKANRDDERRGRRIWNKFIKQAKKKNALIDEDEIERGFFNRETGNET